MNLANKLLKMFRKKNIGRYSGSFEVNWLKDNYEEIKKMYWGKWVCIKGQKIVDADIDFKRLEERIGKQNFVKYATYHIINDEIEVQPNSWGFLSY